MIQLFGVYLAAVTELLKKNKKHITEVGWISKLNIPEPRNRNLSPKTQVAKKAVYV